MRENDAENKTLKVLVILCTAGLLISILLAAYSLDSSPGFLKTVLRTSQPVVSCITSALSGAPCEPRLGARYQPPAGRDISSPTA